MCGTRCLAVEFGHASFCFGENAKAEWHSKGSLKDKTDEAAVDGVITAARKNRAHQEVRVLGNDILHDSWREVLPQEYELAHHYSQRLLEDFYDNRGDVEVILKSKGRIP